MSLIKTIPLKPIAHGRYKSTCYEIKDTSIITNSSTVTHSTSIYLSSPKSLYISWSAVGNPPPTQSVLPVFADVRMETSFLSCTWDWGSAPWHELIFGFVLVVFTIHLRKFNTVFSAWAPVCSLGAWGFLFLMIYLFLHNYP